MNTTATDVKAIVKEKYGQAASRVAQGGRSGCCGASASCGGHDDPITSNLYDAEQAGQIPAQALQASLGCGNPTALAELKAGETVLDLGSGGGIDVLLSARRVGPTGKAFGLDMTDAMLALAEENQRKSGLDNVHFLKGEIEHIPLPDNSVDVIISNCVINLSADKDRVLREAYRVLKPGGRFAVSDVVVRGAVPPAVRRSMELWVGCIAGALTDADYKAKLAAAGFESAAIEVTRVYHAADAREFLAGQGAAAQQLADEVDGKIVSGFIRATKPLAPRAGSAVHSAAATTAALHIDTAAPHTDTAAPQAAADTAAAPASCRASSCCGGDAKV
ncbi:MAG: arsenite methyltransferase [Ideonella sp.]|nr:arsenite methyltransferase [Ideonella sp.]MCC7457649.1 arsenite methyltransferase [Nitrospira sp.]